MKKIGGIALVFVIAALIFLYPLDSYISRPGSAYDIAPLVEVDENENHASQIQGSFSLMTITLGKATPFSYVMSRFSKEMKLLPATSVRMPDEDEAEYQLRQERLMANSQFNALSVAFKQAELPVQIDYNGVIVMKVLEKGAADKILKIGDVIQEVDGEKIVEQGQFASIIEQKERGDELVLSILRNGKQEEEKIHIDDIPNSEGRTGLGIQFEEDRMVTTEPEVNIHTENIGGPSAGFMFTLEILNRITDEDLTKGYAVAGTGEMLEDGTVGRIGGADFKVMAAHKDGMDIFFAPDDDITDEMKAFNPHIESNYEEAKKTAEAIGTEMKIIPVKTIEDALTYLEKLEEKS